jgi:hypothetical protein
LCDGDPSSRERWRSCRSHDWPETTTEPKGLGDTVHKVVKGVQKAAKEARDAAKNGSGHDK